MLNMRVLVVDDEKGYRDEIQEYLVDSGFTVYTAGSPSEAIGIIEKDRMDIAIIDLRLPEMSGIDLMKRIREIDEQIGVIMISGHGDMDSVLTAMREGAIDFFPKPFDLIDIRCAIERTRKYIELNSRYSAIQNTCDNLIEALNKDGGIPLIGVSRSMKNVVKLIEKVSPNPNTDVLITGESGTGKEIVARAIHNLDSRGKKAFFDVNCTAIPEALFESEFFGHTRNAFTGAMTDKKGWFEIANGGTLFLDEIGDLPLTMQAKLLRVLEERKIRRVGSSTDIPLNIRIIASTNRDLETMIEQQQFRNDLFYRLNRFPIYIEPLRDRKKDIPVLLEFYNRHYSSSMKKPLKPFSKKAMESLLGYSYPGNVRELKNMVEKAIILSDKQSKELNLNVFPELQMICKANVPIPEDDLDLSCLEQIEKEMIKCAMQKAGNNKTNAAKALNITRTSLNRRIEKHGLEF
jgi:DNA-binding NtrC family response regulator